MKLNKIPFRYIYLKRTKTELDIYFLYINIFNTVMKEFETYKYLSNLFYIRKGVVSLYFNYKANQPNMCKSRLFFFRRIYKYNFYKDSLIYKHSIPKYTIRESKVIRKIPFNRIFNVFSASYIPEEEMAYSYMKFNTKIPLKKRSYYYRFIYKKFPFRINKYTKDINFTKHTYFDLLKKGFKINKKYHFLKNSKFMYNMRYQTSLLENQIIYFILFFRKFKN
jgi:hypothetical protein